MFKKLKYKKGFTLVELIVVLVILAILAALLVPALTGYIDKARNKQIIAETRSAVMAAQTLVDEAYAKSSQAVKETETADDTNAKVVVGDKEVTYKAIAELAELPVDDSGKTQITGVKIDGKGKVTDLVYKDGKSCHYAAAMDAETAKKALENDGNYYVFSAESGD